MASSWYSPLEPELFLFGCFLAINLLHPLGCTSVCLLLGCSPPLLPAPTFTSCNLVCCCYVVWLSFMPAPAATMLATAPMSLPAQEIASCNLAGYYSSLSLLCHHPAVPATSCCHLLPLVIWTGVLQLKLVSCSSCKHC